LNYSISMVIIIELMTQYILYFLVVTNIAILGWLIFLTVKYRAIMKRADTLFRDKTKGNLSEVIEKYLKDVKEVEDHFFKLDEETKTIRKMSESGLYKSGFVRYNPFGDVGGNQSFSLALLNNKNDGYVISSIHSREGTRVYSKTVQKGGSEYNLSDEEIKAIEIAKK
jgi:hypothetical protein